MKIRQSALALMISGLTLCAPLSAASLDSVYTDLSPAKCRILTTGEGGGATQRCPGIAGYRLLVEEGDARQSITVETPDGRRHPLNYWHVITSGFSTVGEKAEWRVSRERGKPTPVALIVRVNANEHPESPGEKTGYLAVAKLVGKVACVTAKVKGGHGANEEARREADRAASQPCLE